MRLNDWRTEQGLNYSDLAKLLKVEPEFARRMCQKIDHPLYRRPGLEALRRIESETERKVTLADFPEPAVAPPRRKPARKRRAA